MPGNNIVKIFRTKYLSYPKFQLHLIAFNALTFVVVMTPIPIVIHYSMEKLRELGTRAGIDPNHIYFKFMNYQEHFLLIMLIMALICGLLLSALVTLFLSHKLAGPIVRLSHYFDKISRSGEVPKIKFRKQDYFQELPEKVNEALKRILEK